MGFEERGQVAPCLIIGATPQNKIIKEIVEIYNKLTEIPRKKHDTCILTTNYLRETKNLENEDKIQKLEGITIYPKEYFCACNWVTKERKITLNTYCVHHYSASWMNRKEKVKHKIRKIAYPFLRKSK